MYIIKRSTSLLEGYMCLKRAVCCAAVVDDSLLQIALSKGVKGKWGFQVTVVNSSGTCNLKQEVLFQQVQNRNMVSTFYKDLFCLQQNIKLLCQKEWKVLLVRPGAHLQLCVTGFTWEAISWTARKHIWKDQSVQIPIKKKNFIVCCVVKAGVKVVKNPAFFKLVTGHVEGVGGPGFVLHFITVIALWVHERQPTPYMT